MKLSLRFKTVQPIGTISLLLLLVIGVLTLAALQASAAAPVGNQRLINYQGRLRDKATGELVSGSRFMIFSVYKNGSGTAIEKYPAIGAIAVTVNNGVFGVAIPISNLNEPASVISDTNFDWSATWGIGVAVCTTVAATSCDTFPTQSLASVPTSLNADMLDGHHWSEVAALAGGNFIQNQNAAEQTANFWISGDGHAGSLTVDGTGANWILSNTAWGGSGPGLVFGGGDGTFGIGAATGRMNLLIDGAFRQNEVASTPNWFYDSVGVGTTNPLAKLDVVGTLALGTGATVAPTMGTNAITIRGSTSNYNLNVQDGAGRVNYLWNASAGNGTYLVANEPATRFVEGVNAVGATFDFYGAAAGTAGAAIAWTQMGHISSNDQIWFSPRGTSSDLFVANTGNVGIGTTAPTTKLEVHAVNTQAISILSDGATNWASLALGRTGVEAEMGVAGGAGYFSNGAVATDLVIRNNTTTGRIIFTTNAGAVTPRARIETNGDFHIAGTYFCNGADLAEGTPAVEKLLAGDVVSLDEVQEGKLRRSQSAYETNVAGVVSTDPGMKLGENAVQGNVDSTSQIQIDGVYLALAGRVPVKATTANGPIKVGDLLVTSGKAGYAMRGDRLKIALTPGVVLGKAMQSLKSGEGTVLMLVNLR